MEAVANNVRASPNIKAYTVLYIRDCCRLMGAERRDRYDYSMGYKMSVSV